MPPLPRVTARETIGKLERDGWSLARHTGGHAHFHHPTKRGVVTVPIHGSRVLVAPVLRSILRQVGLSVEEFTAL